MAEPKFQFYEYVRVVSADPELAEIDGERGAILGRSEDEDGGYGYAVLIAREERSPGVGHLAGRPERPEPLS